MLPFMKAKKLSSVLMAKTKPEGGMEMMAPEDDTNHAMLSASEDLISAVHSKDATLVAAALEAAYDICESREDQAPVGDVDNE